MPAFTLFLRRLLLVLIASCTLHLPSATAALIDFQASSPDAVAGGSVAVNVAVSGLGDFAPESLGAFDIDVAYDPAVFAFSGYSLGALLGDLGSVQALDASGGDSGGNVNIAEVSLLSEAALDALQPAAFILATLTFDVLDLALGATSQLSLGSILLGNSGGDALPATGGGPATFVGSSAVPTAGTLLLFLAGLAGMLLARRRA